MRAHAAAKRGKGSSDEDSGGEKGSHREDEDEKCTTPDGSSGDDDYRQVKSKRQKVKEKKKRQKAKKAEAALRPALLLPEETERERVWILDSLKPSPEAVDQALAGHPATHPQLLRLLVTADALSVHCPPSRTDLDPSWSILAPILRRLTLSSSPLTLHALNSAIDRHFHHPSSGTPTTPL